MCFPKGQKEHIEPQTDFCKFRVVFSHVILQMVCTKLPQNHLDHYKISSLRAFDKSIRSLEYFKSEPFPKLKTLFLFFVGTFDLIKLVARWQFFQEFFDILIALQTHHWYLSSKHNSIEVVKGFLVEMYKLLVVRAPHHPTENSNKKYMYRTIYTGNLSSLSYHLFDFKLIQKAQTLKPFQRKNSSQSDQFMVKLHWRWFCPNELSSKATWQIHHFMFQVENSRGCFYWCQETL